MQHAELIRLAEEQAEDEGLWFNAKTASEAYLQQELRRLHAAIESLPVGVEEKPDEEIVFWMSEDELYYTIGLQNEARTVTIPIHTFPLHSNDIPIKIKVTSKEALSAEFTAKHPDWDKFL